MAIQNSENLYDALVASVKKACVEKNYVGTLDLCKTEAMNGGEQTYNAIGQHYIYEKSFEDGGDVKLEFKWYDKSKPFSIQPDINRFAVTLSRSTGADLRHTNSYED